MTKLRKQYHFRNSPDGLMAWDVTKLIEKSSLLEVKEIPLGDVQELDECYWFDFGGAVPTCRNVVDHMQLINETDLQHPIILSNDGRVMDGMHRVCKALLEGESTIKAVRFEETIPPDFVGLEPGELSYDD